MSAECHLKIMMLELLKELTINDSQIAMLIIE